MGWGGGKPNAYSLLQRGGGGSERPQIVLRNKWTAPNIQPRNCYSERPSRTCLILLFFKRFFTCLEKELWHLLHIVLCSFFEFSTGVGLQIFLCFLNLFFSIMINRCMNSFSESSQRQCPENSQPSSFCFLGEYHLHLKVIKFTTFL